MPGIYIAAALATVATLAVWGLLIIKKAPKTLRLLLAVFFLLELPMSALTYYLVRLPVSDWYGSFAAPGSPLHALIKSFEAPLTEEPAKFLPLLLFVLLFPSLKRKLPDKSGWFIGLALGLGFGVGEAWTVPYLIAQSNPEVLALPWYYSVGAVFERTAASFMHGVFTSFAAVGALRGFWHGVKGFGKAIVGHYLLNFFILLPLMIPAIPQAVDFVYWQAFIGIYTGLYFLLLLYYWYKKAVGKRITLSWALGQTTCKHCQRIFAPGLFTLNFLAYTGQRCPHCKKWGMYQYHPLRKHTKI